MYEFSIGALFIGIAIMAAGGAVVIYHRQIAENFASGVQSYDKVKLFGLIAIGVGLIVATGLHTLILNGLMNLIFRRA